MPLAQVFDWSEESASDLIKECLSNALENFGELAFAQLEAFINQPDHQSSRYIGSANVIGLIGIENVELRQRAIQIITNALDAHFARNDKDVNGFWLADLLDLEAVEIEFGMREERETPPPPPLFFPEMFRDIGIKSKSKTNSTKEKNKNKQAKKSRKKNRKKK